MVHSKFSRLRPKQRRMVRVQEPESQGEASHGLPIRSSTTGFRSLPYSTQAVDLDDQVNPVQDSEDPIPVMDLQSLKLGEA
ncbi:hypothetical protein ACFX2F_007656 [Malus domestica]